ncbi:ABC transporter permease [Saccharothrix sp. NRRL B-16348]|uniref:carbohydrate ABC transporter permease n=1 Tax=Saccharothrix sp. NRRL B-16348 TaxID=1415542 RepID=UPI0006AE577A|nr:sugar ABC transporter permease [Saccharothrix sp. NRRL B-16348]KOX23990.1 ABC transporter permease [Saccharothrix sp. NRRL B-16348]
MTAAVPPLPRPRRARGGTLSTARRREGVIAIGMAGPAVLLLLVFFVIPVGLAFALAFTSARLISPTPARFVGLRNFAMLAEDPVFLRSVLNTFAFAAVVVPVQAGLALGLALLVNGRFRGTNFFRTVYFIPVVTSMVVVSIVWTFLYRKDGLLNRIIDAVTFGHVQGPDWLNDPSTSLAAIVFMSVWQGAGFHMIIWLAGLQTIPAELHEAASIDGVSRWTRFRFVTWPGLRATRTFVLITITISAFSLFTQVNVMTQGGPLDSTTTLVYQAVRSGYQQQQTAYASAISLVFFVLVLIVSLVQRHLTREKD